MKHVIQSVVLITGLLLSSMRAVAATGVEHMSDIEICEYAARMSTALDNIKYYQICEQQDTQCVRTELARYGVSYEDKEILQQTSAHHDRQCSLVRTKTGCTFTSSACLTTSVICFKFKRIRR